MICNFKNCYNTFEYRSNKKYCSRRCKQKAKDCRSKERTQRLHDRLSILTGDAYNKYQKYKIDSCEVCGFEPLDKCQLDVDHIDGDHNNNNEDNLQTLCANCHRLKTYNLTKFKESTLTKIKK